MQIPTFDPASCGVYGVNGPERSDAAAHRRAIVRVARELFSQHGVDAVSMKDIAQGAGVGQGTLYRKFASKGEVAAAVLADGVAELRSRTVGHLEADGSEATADWFLDELVRFVCANSGLLSEAMRDQPQVAGRWPQRSPIHRWLQSTLQGLLEVRHPTAPYPSEQAAEVLMAWLDPDRVGYRSGALGLAPSQLASELRDLAGRLMAVPMVHQERAVNA